MDYHVENGIYHLDFELSKLEKQILDHCCEVLEEQGFQYISIPSTIKARSFKRQDINVSTLRLNDFQYLAGSAEQGILEYFSDQHVSPLKVYARNTCFREENEYFDLLRVKEFQKVEQYIFCYEDSWENSFEHVLTNAMHMLEEYMLDYRLVDVTNKDPGYHIKKIDIEVLTKEYGWIETHSCTYFGEEQSKRFGITGANHTISNTGIATPRILIPILERLKGA